MKKISVIIICGNEEKNISACLESVKWAAEIIVVDSESTDNTREIAAQFTDKVLVKPWQGYAKQKSFALQQAENDWILSLDADERITPELQKEIEEIDSSSVDGYFIGRKNHFLGKYIGSCGWDKDFQLRLFNKNKASMTDRLVHEGFVVKGEIGYLKNKMIHFTYNSIAEALEKINNYSSLQAKELYCKKKVSSIGILLRSISQFLIFFVSLKGYKDGIHGLMISFFNSITTALTYTKIWELKKRR